MAKAKKHEEDTVEAVGGNAQQALKDYAARINSLQDQIETAKMKHIDPLREDQKAIYAKAKGEGFDKKALSEVVRKSRMKKELRDQIDIYEHAILGDLLD